MRYRIRDLLLATALTAIYLTAMKYLVISVDFGSMPRWGTKLFAGTFICFYFFGSILTRRWRIQKAKPIACELKSTIPWTVLTLQLIVPIAIAVVVRQFETRIAASVFVGSSMPFLANLIMSFLWNTAIVSTQGIIYQAGLWPWEKITILRGHDSKIQKLQVGKPWSGFAITVSSEQQAIIENLLSKNAADTTNAPS